MRAGAMARGLNACGLFNLAREVLYFRDRFDRAVLDHYRRFVRPGTLCFDIGANIGRVTDILLCVGARVVLIEPNPDCVRYLRGKYRSNKKVTIIPCALDAVPGMKKLFVCEANSLSSLSEDWINSCKKSGRYDDFHWDRSVEIETTTLDTLISAHGEPDYIKIDVEGMEFGVLSGLNRKVKSLSFEICPETISSTEKCIDKLASLGPDARFNLSAGEIAAHFYFSEWRNHAEIKMALAKVPGMIGHLFVTFGQERPGAPV